MQLFANVLAMIFLATYAIHTVSAAPNGLSPGGIQYFSKRHALSASTWRSEEDPHAFMNAKNLVKNMRRQILNDAESTLSTAEGPSVAADAAQTVENNTGTDRSQASVGPVGANTSSVPTTIGEAANIAQGAASSPPTTSTDNAISLSNDSPTTSESAAVSSVRVRRKNLDDVRAEAPKSISIENAYSFEYPVKYSTVAL
ncbi:hypothetical protein JR316_0010417 [Psilocybe cubensis]|uniref:Uncharacterized protein n=2 Tax=Psilocybe cubensis TaxID=181762 RepID=A0A8H7XK16_PSICU|nr:hypothetical protein JR316_0010417 [Psilocybe cubensis]KAH9476505.1 hypothetical protein JR316_0010417 [Psilocybe cubensis]